jgi:hypothetical protein
LSLTKVTVLLSWSNLVSVLVRLRNLLSTPSIVMLARGPDRDKYWAGKVLASTGAVPLAFVDGADQDWLRGQNFDSFIGWRRHLGSFSVLPIFHRRRNMAQPLTNS